MTLTEQFVKDPRLFSFSHIHPIYQAVKKVINSLSLAVSPAVTNLKNVHTISNCCLKIFSRVNWPIHSVDSRKTSRRPVSHPLLLFFSGDYFSGRFRKKQQAVLAHLGRDKIFMEKIDGGLKMEQ